MHQPAPASAASTSLRFSIILCTYNRRSLVLSALASLRRQTLPYSAFEVIVIDNGSSDGTLGAVRTYVTAGQHEHRKTDETWKVQCLSEPQNGLAYARNTGLLAASGAIAVFLDDDIIAGPHFLERLWAAYEETSADAVGGRVEIRWEAGRPHWLSDDMLEMLGYFAPTPERAELDASPSFSSSCFSVKIEALRAIGYFSPFLSKRWNLPASTEVQDMCRRLRSAGYKLWYEPGAVVEHRAPAARLTRPFFMGRAYWQGRSAILAEYGEAKQQSTSSMVRAAVRDLREIVYLACVHRPLLHLAGRSTSEHIYAAMDQARSWGRLRQRLAFLEHAPADLTAPSVLFIRSPESDPTADLLARALHQQEIRCTTGGPDIPLSWLWQHRAYRGKAMGVLHFYRPGALKLTHRQLQRLWFRLWLARRWGIRVVTTDAGGWWQSVRGFRFLSHRLLERKLMHYSDATIGYTRQPERLYPDKKVRRRVRCLPHPGFLGYFPAPLSRDAARKQLGFPAQAGFAYLCLAPLHTERELIHLVEAFRAAARSAGPQTPAPQLLLIGSPRDKRLSTRILKLAAHHSSIHLHLADPTPEDIPLYLGAIDAVVLPHFTVQTAGSLETAMLALSYGRVVVAPNLPRFAGMLPPRASKLYEPASRASLSRALLDAQQLDYHLTEKEKVALDAESGWNQYAHRLLKVYRELLDRER